MAKPQNSNPIHKLTISVMEKGLRNFAGIMDKTEQHAIAREIPLANLLQARLFPDMFNLLQQIQYICYLSVDYSRHFSSDAPPRVGYDEETWQQLRTSLDAAAAFLHQIAPERLTADAGKLLPTFMDDTKAMTAVDYAAEVIVPDFHFHLVIAYALLRHSGVAVGKSDYFGKLEMVTLEAQKS